MTIKPIIYGIIDITISSSATWCQMEQKLCNFMVLVAFGQLQTTIGSMVK
jgi:hypothetical protein